MSYTGISVKKAVLNLNNDQNGWFLPAIQRPYVWGSRHESEEYICKLFDSILKGYPIGGLIIWNTEESIPYREFMNDYKDGISQQIVDKGKHARKDKWLVYDGQQRLQTIYSCLKYTFNGKVLVYDLLFDDSDEDNEEMGFSFVEKNTDIKWNFIRMNEIFIKDSDDNKRDFRKAIFNLNKFSDLEEGLIEKNIDLLWDIFVKTETNSLAYFPIQTKNEKIVNEIFERLNTGGVALSSSDILFSRIKDEYPNFEEQLQNCSNQIYTITSNGYTFSAYNILQLIHLIVKGRVRVDPKKLKKNEYKKFKEKWEELESPLYDFFSCFLWGQFNINNNAIIPKNLSILPIIVYFIEIYNKGYKYKNISAENLKKIHQYFIKSQINDWALQSYIDNFSRIIKECSEESSELFDFPLPEIEQFISIKKQRRIKVYEEAFTNYRWFSLKILLPSKIYHFGPNVSGRFNPQIDHIFPVALKGKSQDYKDFVDVLWNLQPIKTEINGLKTNLHPKTFFSDKGSNSNGDIIEGSKYLMEYNFLEPLNDDVWNDFQDFVNTRKSRMIDFLKTKYDIGFTKDLEID
jgi:uncharacterized protein with ParB-like and HNH nuclease domain